MRFETFEPRIVFDQSLGPAIEFELDKGDVSPAAELPSDIQFRDTKDDFEYSSDTVNSQTLDELIAATDEWALDSRGVETFSLNEDDVWHKVIRHNAISVDPDGFLVSERESSDADTHTQVVMRKKHSDCYLQSGLHLRPNYHYRYSFDVRHPETELSWLTEGADGSWAIVSQLWGPRDNHETFLNPSLAIFSYIIDNEPYWAIRSVGDSRQVTPPSGPESDFRVTVPMQNIGEWTRFDIEYVPDHTGEGLVRVWLDGEKVAEWVDIISTHNAINNNQLVGPLMPSFGLYSYDARDGQEAHYDNISMECNGAFESSVSGRITGTELAEGNPVYATNTQTGERFGTYTEGYGVYVLELPKGEYTITGHDQLTGQQSIVTVSTENESSIVADLEVVQVTPPPASQPRTFSADVDGDGASDLIRFHEDGTWKVTTALTDSTLSPESEQVWGKWSSDVEWKDFVIGDFTDDGRADIAARAGADGSWWVASAESGGSFKTSHWGQWSTAVEWENVMVGDFDGNGHDDIIGRASGDGAWWVAMSDHDSKFQNVNFGRWSKNVDWDFFVGDFDGDGSSDVAGKIASSGIWWVGLATDNGFLTRQWGQFSSAVQWVDFQVGDFDGDGKSDIMGRVASDGSWWMAKSTGTLFQNTFWGKWSTRLTWADVTVADVNGDGKSDIVGRVAERGTWWIAESTGDSFSTKYWGALWSTEIDWISAIVDDFDGDGRADLLGQNVGNWWLST